MDLGALGMIPTGSISSCQNSAAQASHRTKGSWRHDMVGTPSDQSRVPKKLMLRSPSAKKESVTAGAYVDGGSRVSGHGVIVPPPYGRKQRPSAAARRTDETVDEAGLHSGYTIEGRRQKIKKGYTQKHVTP